MPDLIEAAPAVLIPPDALGEPFAPGGRELDYHGAIFGTRWSLRVLRRAGTDPAGDAAFLASVLRTCHQVLELIDAQISLWRPDSDIARFNRLAAGERIALAQPISIVVQKALDISRETAGAFCPGLYEAVDQWGFGASPQDDPVAAGLAHAHAHAHAARQEACGTTLPQLAGDTLTKSEGFALDLNGIAKGYAVDLLCDVVRSHPETVSCLVEIGGELKGVGTRADGMPFWTDIAANGDPDTASHRVALHGWACATSGVAERFHERAGTRFSHIIDPATLSPTRTDLAAATVLDKECARADALATALMVMGSEEGLSFANANAIACILTPERQGKAVLSDALRDWIEDE